MATEAGKNHTADQQAALDDFNTSLEQSDVSPETRKHAAKLFEEALQDAAEHPKTAAEVLQDWQETVGQWNEQFEAMQKRGEISATDAADVFRQFEQITQTLQGFQNAESNVIGEAPVAQGVPTPLPQGMPADVAAALGRSVHKS